MKADGPEEEEIQLTTYGEKWYSFDLDDGNGQMKNRITKGAYQANTILKIDEKNRVIYFLGYGKEKGRDPYYNFYYRVGFNGSSLKLLIPEDATHSFDMPESMKYFVGYLFPGGRGARIGYQRCLGQRGDEPGENGCFPDRAERLETTRDF